MKIEEAKMNELKLGVDLMLYGLAGVFVVLILFYAVIRILNRLFPSRAPENED